MNGMTVYLITRVIEIGSTLSVVGVILAVSSVLTLIIAAVNQSVYTSYPNISAAEKATATACFSWFKKLLIASIFVGTLSVLCPSKDDMLLIAGAELTNQTVKELTPELGMVRQWVDQELKDKLKPQGAVHETPKTN